MQKTIEQQVADAILERDISEIEINGEKFAVGAPTIATLILVSEIVSTLPVVEQVEEDKRLYSVLHHAKNFKAVGDIAAVLILGAKGLSEEVVTYTEEKRLFGLVRKKVEHRSVIDKKAKLSKLILENVSPSVLFNSIVLKLNRMEIGHFFAITTSLSEANLLKPTKEVVKD